MAVVATGEMAVTPDLKGFESKLGSSLGNVARKAATIFGGAFAATKAVDFLSSAVADARESNRIAAQTAAAIKSTGGAAHVTAKQVDDLANSLSRKTGIDDEEIAKTENLLLTFTNLQNRVGKGNDIFNQATAIAADMGKALGQDASSSAIQLGKALNDPVKGITALTRVGVTFSDVQKKQIEDFVKAGKVADAQKVILAELSKEFGGSAEAQATAGDRLKVTIGNLKEDLGNKLIPILDRVASFLADKLPGAMAAAGKAFGTIQRLVGPVAQKVGAFLKTLFTGFTEDEGTPIEMFALRVRDALEKVAGALRNVIDFANKHKEVLVGFGAAVAAILVPAFVAWATAAGAAAIATLTAAAPVIAVAAAIGVLVAGLAYAYKHWTGFREVVDSVVQFVTGSLIPALGSIVAAIGNVIGWVRDNWPQVLIILTGPIGLAVVAITRNFDKVKEVGAAVFGGIKDAVEGFINAIKRALDWVGKLIEKISHLPGSGIAKSVLHAVGVPGFASGGVVPGPVGAPQLAVVHGGEEVLTYAERRNRGISVSVAVYGNVTEQQAYAAGRAAGRGINDEMARTELRRAAKAK